MEHECQYLANSRRSSRDEHNFVDHVLRKDPIEDPVREAKKQNGGHNHAQKRQQGRHDSPVQEHVQCFGCHLSEFAIVCSVRVSRACSAPSYCSIVTLSFGKHLISMVSVQGVHALSSWMEVVQGRPGTLFSMPPCHGACMASIGGHD